MAVWSEVSTCEITNYRRIDGEFFHPNYIKAESTILQNEITKPLGQLGRFIIGPFGSAFHVSNYDNTSRYRYVRGKDVKPFTLLNDDNVYIPEKNYRRLVKYALQKDDLLISVVGTLGNVAIVPEGVQGIFSCKSTVFRNAKIDPCFLLAYFNSSYGKDCLLRRQRGAIQTGLNKEDLKTVPVPLLPEAEIINISNNIKKALKLSADSQSLYTQAQELLERELGLDKLKFETPLSYEARLSEVFGNNRSDADYYQTKYKQLKINIEQHRNGFQKLIDYVKPLSPNIDPRKSPSTSYSYIELADINPVLGVIDSFSKLLGIDTPSRAKREVLAGDIIASAVVGSVDKAALVDGGHNGCLASTGFFHFRPRNGIQSEFLLLLIRSKCVTMQLQQESTGGILSAVPDERLRNVIVPNIDIKLQQKLGDLVSQAHSNYQRSKLLLEQAKRRVEELIEQAVKK